MSARQALAVTAIGAAVAFGGCTGGSEPTPDAPPPIASGSATPAADVARIGVRTIRFAAPGGGTFDARVWYPTSGGELQTLAASAHLQIPAAHHFSFMPPCRPNAVAILAETKEEFVCQEQAGITRDEIHAETLEALTRFLRERGVLAD
jgi:hypothetical protein